MRVASLFARSPRVVGGSMALLIAAATAPSNVVGASRTVQARPHGPGVSGVLRVSGVVAVPRASEGPGTARASRVRPRITIGRMGSRYVVRSAERWRADVVHELVGDVQVAAGGTLTIEAGTRVEARPGSRLTVARDGRLVAIGTLAEPIELSCASVPRYEGCWEGVTILGNASINHGQPTSPPTRDGGAGGCPQAMAGGSAYGGCLDSDSSGAVRFTRIEYARTGLQLLGVGSRTVVDYVQVNRARGNGVTITGGTVDVRRLFLTANQGVGLAWFGGWMGRGQFLTIHQDGAVHRGGVRGSNAPSEGSLSLLGAPRSNPTLYNVTVVAPSTIANPHHGAEPAAVILAEGTSGTLRNVLLYTPYVGLDVNDELTCTPFDGTLPTLRHVLVAGAAFVGRPDADAACEGYASPEVEAQWLADPANASVIVTDPAQVAALRVAIDLTLPDLRPASGSVGATTPPAPIPSDGFFQNNGVDFIGSVDIATPTRSSIPWYSGWTSPAPPLPPGGVVSGIVGAAPRGPFVGVTVSSASGVTDTTASLGDYTLALAAGTHLVRVGGLPEECAAAPLTVQVPSGGTASVPIAVNCTAAIQLSTGPLHGCAATQDGRTLCWGSNEQGLLGTGAPSSAQNLPRTVLSPFPLTSLTTGYSHTCGVGPGGVAFCWGLNAFAALGNGTLGGATAVPITPASGGVSFSTIAAGGYHSCALTQAGEAWCWGWNLEGQTGIGVVGSPIILPQRVADGGLRFVQLTAGDSHTCALTSAGAAYCWGGNGRGELGDDPAIIGAASAVPVAVPGGHLFTRIDAGRTHTCGISIAGQALCWGERDFGQTGNGIVGGLTIQPTPVSGALTFTAISAGSQTTCGVTSTGETYCWGRGDGGLLGDGTYTAARATPAPLAGGLLLTDVALSLASGAGGVACGRTSLGLLWCWGAGDLGQRGDGTFTPTVAQPVLLRLPPPP